MRVFLSSVIRGFETLRDAASSGIRTLNHQVLRSEDFGAIDETSRQACLRGVREADVVVLVLGEKYGTKQASGRSATHEEYLEARERCPVLAFVQEGVDPDPDQQAFIRDAQAWETGQTTASFRTEDDLRTAVTRALHNLEMRSVTGSVDENELVSRTRAMIPAERSGSGPSLCLAMSAGPRQPVLRPSTLEDDDFQRTLMRDAQYGEPPVLTTAQGLAVRIANDGLYLEQEDAHVFLGSDGSLVLRRPPSAPDPRRDGWLPVLIEDDVRARVEEGLRFFGRTLDLVDSAGRLTDVVVALAVIGAGHQGWRTRAEHERNPNSVQLGMGQPDVVVVQLSPATRKRPALTRQAPEIADDLVALMRREFR